MDDGAGARARTFGVTQSWFEISVPALTLLAVLGATSGFASPRRSALSARAYSELWPFALACSWLQFFAGYFVVPNAMNGRYFRPRRSDFPCSPC